MIEKLREYRYSTKTQVQFMGEWQHVCEVWFAEEKIGLMDSGHIIDYREVEDIRDIK